MVVYRNIFCSTKAKILQPGETMFYRVFLEKKNAICIPIYDSIGKKIKNWKKHTRYFFIPGSENEEITAELSKLVSLICLSLGLFSDIFSYNFVIAAFFLFNPHMKGP